MKSEKEIRETLRKLDQVNGFINNYGDPEEYSYERVEYANNVADVLDWILDDRMSRDCFLEDYIKMPFLERMAKEIEARTGENLEDYKKIC